MRDDLATETVKPPAVHLSSSLKDVGIFLHEFQPQLALRQGYKKSSSAQNCLAISHNHIFAAQVGKAVVNVYNRAKSNQEATVPLPQKISSLAYAAEAAVLVLGTQDGKLMLWETATGRVTTSSASHIEEVTSLAIASDGNHILSASPDSTVHVWSIKNLVSMGEAESSFLTSTAKQDPVSTFSQHRSAVRALAVSHSHQVSTTFVVSASEDRTCYVWNLANQQILRTFLLAQAPQCATLEPGDRAVYFGTEEGGVQQIDLLTQQSNPASSILDNDARIASNAFQLTPTDVFSSNQGAETGPAQCIAISYDGTRLLTGHYSGKIVLWDVPKRRQLGDVPGLSGQSVTNIHLLQPDGFAINGPRYSIQNVVKPRLELNSSVNHDASLAIPADYTFQAQIMSSQQELLDEIDLAMISSSIPQSMLDAAVQALLRHKTSGGQSKNEDSSDSGPSSSDVYKVEVMEKELASLKAQAAEHARLDQERFERHMARKIKREAIGLEKRQAFFVAKKAGKNSDEAMKPYMQREKEIDAESDEEVIARNPKSNGQHADSDVPMKG
ncbi:Pre-rRNA-processing protein ipi3 [Lithohypha guttulata]|nr:Pre-rRNA-processing protein ipi3 [Lithohypha guttulata]